MSNDRSATSAFTRADCRRLLRALGAAARVREYRRLEAVLLVAEGCAVSEAARRVRVARASVHRWVAAYRRTRDAAALADRPRPGRRRGTPELTPERVAAVFAQDPRVFGYRATTWTVALLGAHLREHVGCALSARTLRRRLHEWGYRWKRPRYTYAQRAPHLGQKKGLSSAA